jgi:hypothetical protein
MAKQTITNVSGGPKIVNGMEGAVLIADGTSETVEISDAELKVAKATEWFEFGDKAAKEAAKADDKD